MIAHLLRIGYRQGVAADDVLDLASLASVTRQAALDQAPQALLQDTTTPASEC